MALGGPFMNHNLNSLAQHILNTNHMVVFCDGTQFTYHKGDDKCEIVLSEFVNTIKNASEMPALGVSLDNETQSALAEGLWIEFVFHTTQIHNEMPFDALLIKINPEDSGINLIRKHNGKYDGRCFYLNLKTTLKNFSQLIKEIIKT